MPCPWFGIEGYGGPEPHTPPRILSCTNISIAAAASTWDLGGREATDLYRGGRLEQAVDVALGASERLRTVDHEFIDASRHADDAARAEERRRVRRLRRLVAATAVGLVVALEAGGLAFSAQRRAESATD